MTEVITSRSRPAKKAGGSSYVFAMIALTLMLDIPLFLYISDSGPAPKYFLLLVALLATPLLLKSYWLRVLTIAWPFLLWVAAALFVNVVAWLTAPETQVEVFGQRMQALLFGSYLALIAGAVLRMFALRTMSWVLAVACASIATSFILPDVFGAPDLPGTVLGRAGASWLNPNRAAEALVLLALLALPGFDRRERLLLLAGVGAVVLLTFSRGGLLVWAGLVFVSAVVGLISRLALLLPVMLFLVLAPLGILFSDHVVGALGLEAGAANVLDRLEGLARFEAFDFAARERVEAAGLAIDALKSAPWTGQGPGAMEAIYGIGPHNQALSMAAEYGLLGIGLFVALLMLVATGSWLPSVRYRLAALWVVVGLSMFTHNMLDSMYWILALALLARGYEAPIAAIDSKAPTSSEAGSNVRPAQGLS